MPAILIRVRDLRTYERHDYHLSYDADVDRGEIVIGRDPAACDLVIDDPAIQPRHLQLTAHANQQFYQRLAPDQPRVEHHGDPLPLGPFAVEVHRDNTVAPAGGPPPAFPAYVTGRRLRSVVLPPCPDSPMERVAGQLYRALRAGADRIRTFDRATRAWCEARLAEHVDRLSRATPPHGQALALGRVEYTRSHRHALARYTAAWEDVECQRFEPAAWAYVRRLARWCTADRINHDAPSLVAALRYLVDEQPADAWTNDAWALAHPACCVAWQHANHEGDPDSPIGPLVALAERGAFVTALPSNAMLVYAPWAVDSTVAGADARETALLRQLEVTPDDAEARMVYADLLEQRGELARAHQLRGGDRPAPRTLPIDFLFPRALTVTLSREIADYTWPAPRVATGTPPAGAHLEDTRTGIRMPLYPHTWIGIREGVVSTYDAGAPVAGDVAPLMSLIYDDDVFWGRAEAGQGYEVDDVQYYSYDRPLYDGDRLRVTLNDDQLFLRMSPG